ncbi:hypothetical protein AKO1_007516 [Acrasis kona]|uniref:SEC7 domain-containing protein n=1 Tax=Acrasis kona TaxID=1008807 RepID=A0AAW2YSC2_9EUKA
MSLPDSAQNKKAIKVFYVREIENIIKVAKKNQNVKDACNKIIAHINSLEKEKKDVYLDMVSSPNKYFVPVKLACETKIPVILSHGLSCIAKLMQYSLIDDKKPYESDPSQSLVDAAVQTICHCYEMTQDENVQFEIIKSLNTAAGNCTVRGKSLQLAVKTCFFIHLVSTKNMTNQQTAFTTLMYILNIVFQKLEDHVNDDEQIIDDDEEEVETALTRSESSSSISSTNSAYDLKTLNGGVVDAEGRSATPTVDSTDTIESLMADSTETRNTNYHQDAFIVLKELCKLSIKKLPVVNNIETSIQMRTRLVAMQVLQDILQNSGPGFRASKGFMKQVRRHLGYSILVNGLTTHPTLFDQSIALFKTLIQNFTLHLKMEIGSFLSDVFLKILNSPYSQSHQKQSIMNFLHFLSQDKAGQTFVGLFLNYDCDPNYKINIFHQTIRNISNAMINIHSEPNWLTSAQEAQIKLTGLQTVVNILNMMVELHKKRTRELSTDPRCKKGKEFEDSRKRKTRLREGIELFNNKSAKKGIDFLIQMGFIEKSPTSVARFLYTQEGLAKTRIGEYIGDRDEWNSLVRTAFVNLLDFHNLDMEQAFRKYLQTFLIPGEGQIIDRVMEAFAKRYWQQNHSNLIFKSQDAVHIFAVSVLMLNTELYSQALKDRPRMDLAQFIKNNESINDGGNIDEEYLTKIYNSLRANEVKMLDDANPSNDASHDALPSNSNLPQMKRKQLGYDRETDKIIKLTKFLFDRNSNGANENDDFMADLSGTPHVCSMMEVSWRDILECLDALYDLIVDEKQFTQPCIRAFECAIHISARYDMGDCLKSFVQCIARYAHLPALPIEVRLLQKNVECVKLLLKIVTSEGDYLRDTWVYSLTCVSQLELLSELLKGKSGAYASQVPLFQQMEKLISNGRNNQIANQNNLMRDVFSVMQINPNHQNVMGGVGGQGDQVSTNNGNGVVNSSGNVVDYMNAQQLFSQLEAHFIDTVFTKSAELTNDAVIDFVKALCQVSLNHEINAPPPIHVNLDSKSNDSNSSSSASSSSTSSLERVASIGSSLSSLASSGGQPQIVNNPLNPSTPTGRESGANVNAGNLTSRSSVNLIDSIATLQQQLAQFEPRKFSLQKLTEVAHYNTGSQRDKHIWQFLWYYMSEHFIAVGCHPHEGIANYAVESASQLILSFLDHEQMLMCIPKFQTSLLQPFQKIVEQSKSSIVREVVVKKLKNIVNKSHANIQNGWKCVLDTLSTAIQIPDANNQFIMMTWKDFFDNGILHSDHVQFNEICESGAFPDLITCELSFAKKLHMSQPPTTIQDESPQAINKNQGERKPVPLDAIDAIATCAHQLATGEVKGIRSNVAPGTILFTDSALDVSLWWPVLQGLTKLVSEDSRSEVRKSALTTVTNLLKSHGDKFEANLWNKIFKTLLIKMFDQIQPAAASSTTKESTTTVTEKAEDVPVKPPASRWKGLASTSSQAQEAVSPSPKSTPAAPVEEKKEEVIVLEKVVMTNDTIWVRMTCLQALLNLVEIFDYFYNLIHNIVFDDLMKLINVCFKQETSTKVVISARLSAIGQSALTRLVDLSGNKLTNQEWDQICLLINKLICVDLNAVNTAITHLATRDSNAPLPVNISSFITVQSQVQVQIIQAQNWIALQLSRENTTLQVGHVKRLLSTLYHSYQCAKGMNESDVIVRALTGKGAGVQLPIKNFLEQETGAVGMYLNIILKMLVGTAIEQPSLHAGCLQLSKELFVPIAKELMQRYLTKADIVKETDDYKSANPSEMIELIGIVVQVLNGLNNDCNKEQFDEYVHILYEPLSNLVLSEHRLIRVALRQVFIRSKSTPVAKM